jgi:Uma2 family endonuclease
MGDAHVETLTPSAIKLTLYDYERFPEDGQRHEILDGVEVVTAQPVLRHQRVLGRLYKVVDAAAEAQDDGGEVFFAPAGVILSPHDIVEPDLLYVSGARRGIMEKYVHGAPDIVAEVLSPSSRRTDEGRKKARYELFGVFELWIVDPDADVIRVYRRERVGGRFAQPLELSAEREELLTTPLLSALSVRLVDLFAR